MLLMMAILMMIMKSYDDVDGGDIDDYNNVDGDKDDSAGGFVVRNESDKHCNAGDRNGRRWPRAS